MDNCPKKIKIALVGGGTAGHINPLIAIHSEIIKIANQDKIDICFVYLGDPGTQIADFIKLKIPVKKIFSAKIRRYFSLNNFLEIFKLVLSFFQSLWYFFCEKPNVVFSKGGPGGFTPVIAAAVLKIPVAIHESDSVLSITTKLSSKFSKIIFLAFKEASEKLPIKEKNKCIVVGNPIRQFLLEKPISQKLAKKQLKLDSNKPLLVVMGGSQGAQRINNLIIHSSLQILDLGFQIFHQTGGNLFKEAKKGIENNFSSLKEANDKGYFIFDFFNQNLKEVLSAADIIVSRAGSSIFEFSFFKKPSILIPLPESAQNHQLINALIYKRAGACVVIEENQINPMIVSETLRRLLYNPILLQRMSEFAGKFSKPDASFKIAEKLIELAQNKK